MMFTKSWIQLNSAYANVRQEAAKLQETYLKNFETLEQNVKIDDCSTNELLAEQSCVEITLWDEQTAATKTDTQ
jgi:hypothetical protein